MRRGSWGPSPMALTRAASRPSGLATTAGPARPPAAASATMRSMSGQSAAPTRSATRPPSNVSASRPANARTAPAAKRTLPDASVSTSRSATANAKAAYRSRSAARAGGIDAPFAAHGRHPRPRSPPLWPCRLNAGLTPDSPAKAHETSGEIRAEAAAHREVDLQQCRVGHIALAARRVTADGERDAVRSGGERVGAVEQDPAPEPAELGEDGVGTGGR